MTGSLIGGIALATGSMFCFGGGRGFVSKPLVNSDPSVVTYVSLVVGTIEAFLLSLILGQIYSLSKLTILVLAIFASVGILHYVVSRLFGFTAIKNIGANQVASITTTQIIFALFPAVFLLGEKITPSIIIGSFLIMFGISFLRAGIGAKKRGGNARVGYISAIITAAIYGSTTVMISFGLSFFHYFLAATLLAYLAATLLFTTMKNPIQVFDRLRRLPRAMSISILMTGVTTVSAQILQFAALDQAPVVIVSPIIATSPIIVVLLTWLLAKDVEVFRFRTIASIVLAVVGAAIVAIP